MTVPEAEKLVWFWAWATIIYLVAALITSALAVLLITRREGKTVLERARGITDDLFFRNSLMRAKSTTLLDQDTSSFQDPELEREWQEMSYKNCMRHGARLLHGWLWAICFYRTFRNLMIDPCIQDSIGLPEIFEYIGLVVLLGLTGLCGLRPRSGLYWPVLLTISGYVLGMVLPPLQWGCRELMSKECRISENLYIREAVENFDCSPTAITATLLNMTWILVLPWLVYTKEMMYLAWIWILVYVLWSFLYIHIRDIWYFTRGDVCGRTFFLCVTLIMATIKKHFLEGSSIKKFFADVEMKRASERIFKVFQCMVPTHVVVPMLQNPGATIADPVDKVTIMFIVIADFDSFAASSTPEQLLSFLNEHFSEMDHICGANSVTKIETVGEEYVACVGVVPEDIEQAEAKGHQYMLNRLFQAGNDILELQSDTLKFKIGVHTGPIVAGVIGNKLPRYRLFGDTINTAARMMQKGVVGRLQFGEATHNLLPSSVESSFRGEVEMKGKGMVKAWLFEKMLHSMKDEPSAPCEGSVSLMSNNSLSSFRGGMMKAKFDKQLFESLLRDDGMLGSILLQERPVFSYLTGSIVFKPEYEAKWFQEFHEKTFMKKFVVRLTRQLSLLLAMTICEMCFLTGVMIHYNRPMSKYIYPVPRLPIYLGCRVVSMLLVLYWRHAFLMGKEQMMQSALRVQRLMLLTTCCILMLTFISHNIIALHQEKGSMRTGDNDKLHAPPGDQLFLPMFVLAYFLISTTHSLRFYPTLWTVPLSILIMVLCYGEGVGTLFFSLSGKLLFIINSFMNVFLAFNEEQGSRRRFQARAVVDKTRERTETILRTLMPSRVVDELRANPSMTPSHEYKKVMIQQSDLCGFTKLASTRTPREVVDFIGELFGMFDDLTDTYGIYKVETIGDAYIAGQGESPLTAENRPVNVIRFGLESVKAVNKWSKKLGGDPVGCRVGIHYGECIGGVVGTDMQRYHLFGGLMTVLEIMESCGKQDMVHVSSAAYEAFEKSLEDEPAHGLQFEKRMDPDLRTSKGEMHTYDEAGGPTFFVSVKPGQSA